MNWSIVAHSAGAFSYLSTRGRQARHLHKLHWMPRKSADSFHEMMEFLMMIFD